MRPNERLFAFVKGADINVQYARFSTRSARPSFPGARLQPAVRTPASLDAWRADPGRLRYPRPGASRRYQVSCVLRSQSEPFEGRVRTGRASLFRLRRELPVALIVQSFTIDLSRYRRRLSVQLPHRLPDCPLRCVRIGAKRVRPRLHRPAADGHRLWQVRSRSGGPAVLGSLPHPHAGHFAHHRPHGRV